MTTRGIRNNNPGNIIVSGWTRRQPGYTGNDGNFAKFLEMSQGIAAIFRLLQSYRIAHGLTTVREIINRWAPPVENETTEYVKAVCATMGVDADAPLPDDPQWYRSLAYAIAKHECAPDHVQITSADWERAVAAVFGDAGLVTSSPVPQPQPEATAPAEPQPKKEAPKMPLPAAILTAAGSVLFDLVSDLFRGHGSKTSVRNAEIIEKVGPSLVAVAKTVSGDPTLENAVEKVVQDPQTRSAFRAAVADDLDRLMGMIARSVEIDDDSRDRAAARAGKEKDLAEYLVVRQFWLFVGMSVATVAAIVVALGMKAPSEIVVGLVVLFTGLANETKAKWGTMVEYRFGSSSGSQAKDAILARVRER